MSEPLSNRIRAMRDAEYPTRADWDRAYYGTFPPPPPHWRRDEALWQEMAAILSTPPPRPAGRAGEV